MTEQELPKEVIVAEPTASVDMVQSIEIKNIRFKNLSAWLKIAIIGGWIAVISSLAGVIMGLLE